MNLPTEYDDDLDYTRPKESPLVSIIIPAYNSGKYIERCLDSIVAQTYKKWEAIVVYAPSTDDTFAKLVGYPDGRIVVIGEGKKTNVATARNCGFEISHGDYIVFLDSDDWMEPTRIERQVNLMEESKGIQLVDTSEWCWGFVRCVSEDGSSVISKVPPTEPNGLLGVLSLMIRRRSVEEFNESLPFFDDVDFFLRIRKRPHCVIPDVVTNYYLNPSGLTQTTKAINSELTLWKILMKNNAWEYFPYKAKDSGVLAANYIFGTDLVRWNKERKRDA